MLWRIEKPLFFSFYVGDLMNRLQIYGLSAASSALPCVSCTMAKNDFATSKLMRQKKITSPIGLRCALLVLTVTAKKSGQKHKGTNVFFFRNFLLLLLYRIGIYIYISSVLKWCSSLLGVYNGGCGGGRGGNSGGECRSRNLIADSCRGKYNYHMWIISWWFWAISAGFFRC